MTPERSSHGSSTGANRGSRQRPAPDGAGRRSRAAPRVRRTGTPDPRHTIMATLDSSPPELGGDVKYHGITFTGGSALIGGLDQLIRHETGMPVHVCDDPLRTVVV